MLKEQKPVNAAAVNAMKLEDKHLSDRENSEGLGVFFVKTGTKTPCYQYLGLITNKLYQM